MKKLSYILTILILSAHHLVAQVPVDTLCTGGGTSHFGIPLQTGVEFHWVVNGGQILGRQDTNIIEVQWSAFPGTFEVMAYVTDDNGCPGDTSLYIIQIKNPASANGKAPTDVCVGSYITIESSLVGNYMWGGGQTASSLSFVATSDTMVSLIALNDPCPNDTVNYFITVHDQPTAGMNNLQDTVLISSTQVVYHTGSANPAEIEWWFNGKLISNKAAVEIEFNQEGYHKVLQIVKLGLCIDTIIQWVYVEDILKVFIPNAFTPNGDGINDYFRFKGVGMKSYEAEIYNRWGERIYSWNSDSPVDGWDGTNSGQESKIDAYVYRIRVIDMRDQGHFYTDKFSLVR